MPSQSRSGEYAAIVRAINQSQRALREIAVRTAAEFDLFPGEMDVLAALAEFGELRMGDLARGMSVSPPNATRFVKQLESKGLVRRARSKVSDREVKADLTARGQSVNRACGAKLEAALGTRIRGVLDKKDRETVLGLLDRFSDSGRPAAVTP